jgi:hypothetical protein
MPVRLPTSMSSVDPSKPTSGRAYTADVRQNFQVIKNELDAFPDTTDPTKGDNLVGVKLTATGSVARTQHDKNADVVSVKDFGAVGDGVTDDYAAIMAAAAVGAEVPPGVYAFGTPIVSSGKFVLFSKYGFPEVQGNSPQSAKPLVSFLWTGSDSATAITLDTTGASQVVFKDIAVYVPKTFTGTGLKVRGSDSTSEPNRADVDISPAFYRTPLDTGVGFAPGDSTSIAVHIDCVNDGSPRTGYGWRLPNVYAFNFNTELKVEVSGASSWWNGNFIGNVKGYQVFRWLDALTSAGAGETISNNVFQSTIIQPGKDSGAAYATGCTRFDRQVNGNIFFGMTLYDLPDANKLVITNPTAGSLNAFFGSNLPYTAGAVNYAALDSVISFPDRFLFSRNNVTKVRVDGDGLKFGSDTAAINALTKFEATTFTPGLTFNNAAVGMTGTFTGRYVRIGNAIMWDVAITLTAKGSSTGTARITGFPTNSAAANPGGGHVRNSSGLTLATAGSLFLDIAPSNTVGTLRKATATGGMQAVSETEFTDTSVLNMCGTYFV